MTLTNNEKKSFRLREFIKGIYYLSFVFTLFFKKNNIFFFFFSFCLAMHELENIKMTSPNLIPCIYNIYLFVYLFSLNIDHIDI